MNSSARRVFTHLSQEHADSYRTILETFATAREQFQIHLRPAEILRVLRDNPNRPANEEELAARLQQLVEWGNLEKSPDRMEATTVEEFYRARYLYQLSEAGEAAEAALRHFEETLHRPGELQTEALRNIAEFLRAIRQLLDEPKSDIPKIHAQLANLFDRFEKLTNRAQAFMRGLQSTVDLHEISDTDFLEYKKRLLDYLERFLSDLVMATSQISTQILDLPSLEPVLPAIAQHELIDSLDKSNELAIREQNRWRGRWTGFCRWFLGANGELSQAEILRRRARESIPALLYTVQAINDKRVSKSDRHRDWQKLALWFAEAPNDDDAHRLWRNAFAMTPARHLQINKETLDRRDEVDETPRTSWLDADPIVVNPKLRATGRVTSRGGPAKIIDTSKEREYLKRQAEEEARQLELARERLAANRPMLLSEFEELNPQTFELLLDLLGEAMANRNDPNESIEASSTDGALTILLEPFDSGREARIRTSNGVLRGPDASVQIRESWKA